MDELITGGCFCGAIRYQFAASDYPSANCHCSMCRRISAAAFVSWLVVPKKDFEYIRGLPKELKSSAHLERYFCEDCGTPVACISNKDPDNIDVTICSLDFPERFTPKLDIYKDSKLSWLK